MGELWRLVRERGCSVIRKFFCLFLIKIKMVHDKYSPEWRPSSVPPPRWNGRPQQDMGHNPSLPPKPPGKTLMYVYEHPDGTTTYHTVNQETPVSPEYTTIPAPLSRNQLNGYGEVDGYGMPITNGHGSPEVVRSGAAHNGRGYNVLADVGDGPTLRPSSRAGRLFAKQQERMPKYTSESQASPQPAARTAPPTPLPRRCATSFGERNMPWVNGNGNKKSNVKWGVPQHLQSDREPYEDVNGYRGSALAPLPQPLPEWRAKTETGYKFGDPPIRPFSSVGFGNTHSGWGDKNSYYPFTVGSKIGIPVATVSFDARLYQVNPHRKQVAQDAYTPELFLMRDFHARPVGWTREFVDQYYHGRI